MQEPQISKAVAPQVDEMILGLLEWVEKAGDFVVEQSPLYVQDVLTWAILDGVMTGVACFVFPLLFAGSAALPFFLTRRVVPDNLDAYKGLDKSDCTLGLTWVGVVGGLSTMAVFSIAGLPAFWQAFQAYFAPRVFLIEYLRDLV